MTTDEKDRCIKELHANGHLFDYFMYTSSLDCGHSIENLDFHFDAVVFRMDNRTVDANVAMQMVHRLRRLNLKEVVFTCLPPMLDGGVQQRYDKYEIPEIDDSLRLVVPDGITNIDGVKKWLLWDGCQEHSDQVYHVQMKKNWKLVRQEPNRQVYDRDYAKRVLLDPVGLNDFLKDESNAHNSLIGMLKLESLALESPLLEILVGVVHHQLNNERCLVPELKTLIELQGATYSTEYKPKATEHPTPLDDALVETKQRMELAELQWMGKALLELESKGAALSGRVRQLHAARQCDTVSDGYDNKLLDAAYLLALCDLDRQFLGDIRQDPDWSIIKANPTPGKQVTSQHRNRTTVKALFNKSVQSTYKLWCRAYGVARTNVVEGAGGVGVEDPVGKKFLRELQQCGERFYIPSGFGGAQQSVGMYNMLHADWARHCQSDGHKQTVHQTGVDNGHPEAKNWILHSMLKAWGYRDMFDDDTIIKLDAKDSPKYKALEDKLEPLLAIWKTFEKRNRGDVTNVMKAACKILEVNLQVCPRAVKEVRGVLQEVRPDRAGYQYKLCKTHIAKAWGEPKFEHLERFRAFNRSLSIPTTDHKKPKPPISRHERQETESRRKRPRQANAARRVQPTIVNHIGVQIIENHYHSSAPNTGNNHQDLDHELSEGYSTQEYDSC